MHLNVYFHTDTADLMLNTEKRAGGRLEWESHVSQKRTEDELAKAAAEKLRQKQEEEEYKRQRQEAVHKAQPVRHYKGVTVQPTPKLRH
jgi:targeting protein for Xklp2